MRVGVQVKYLSTSALLTPKRFKNLGAAVALHGRDAHLRADLDHTFERGLDVFVLAFS